MTPGVFSYTHKPTHINLFDLRLIGKISLCRSGVTHQWLFDLFCLKSGETWKSLCLTHRDVRLEALAKSHAFQGACSVEADVTVSAEYIDN